jgi:hypothetical protein
VQLLASQQFTFPGEFTEGIVEGVKIKGVHSTQLRQYDLVSMNTAEFDNETKDDGSYVGPLSVQIRSSGSSFNPQSQEPPKNLPLSKEGLSS